MKSSVETLTDTRVKITVEVPFDELKPDFDLAYKEIAKQVTIPGFRRGKAPRQLIDARFGRGMVIEQVVHDVLPRLYEEAIKDAEVRPVAQPEIEVTKVADGDVFEFVAVVDVFPDFELPDFSAISVSVEPLAASDEDVDAAVDKLRERFSTLVTVERAIENGDIITGDFLRSDAGEDATPDEGRQYEVTDSDRLPVSESLVGKSVGDEVTVEIEAADEDNDKPAVTLTINITKVQVSQLPEFDDDFAMEASEFDTAEELRESIAEQTKEQAKATQAAQLRDAVLKQAIAETEFELPQALVDQRVEQQVQQMLSQVNGDERMFAQLLSAQGMTRAEFDERTRNQAEEGVRTQLFLDVLAQKLNVEVNPRELQEHIQYTAMTYGMDPNVLMQQIASQDLWADMFADVARGKALAQAICQVTATDTNGESVNPSEYFGPEDEDEDSEGDLEDTPAEDKQD